MSESVKVNQNIRRNTNGFSFADKLGSFINNFEFSRGYDEFSRDNPTNKAYLWNVLSNIGNDYAQEIYQNVLNYIDNAANVDLCKIRALKSMASILGLRYQIFDNIDDIPLEVLQTLDVLSINKGYLLNSKVFCSEFREELSSYPGMIVEDSNNNLSSELCSSFIDPSTGKELSLSDFTQVSTYIDFNNNNNILEESYYGEFLVNVYRNLLNHFIYLQYADVENGISSAKYDYIYQHIANKLIGIQSTSDEVVQDRYDKTINELKTKYKIGKNFDESMIVDNIERDIDSLDNYDSYKRSVLEVEMKRRTDTYLTDGQKEYSDEQRTLGNNVTRFSYYRERKVIEYFNFIQNTYNNLITATDIESAVGDNSSKIISVYDKDHNYFNLDQGTSSKLLTYDRDTQDMTINTNMIQMIVQLMAQQTLELVEIREQLKVQMQRTYMKGTFLLLSYAINEYLKYNIANKYGDKIYTKDGATSLRDFIEKALQDKNNVELVEYNDATQYYNIQNEEVDANAINSTMVNPRFWDSDLGKIGQVTKDLPLDEISDYYMHHLHLDKCNVTDTTEFLSILFEFGANNSFLSTSTPQDTEQFNVQLSDFVCQLPDGTYIHDPEIEVSNNDLAALSADELHGLVDQYVGAGYQLLSESIDKQVARLLTFISSYYSPESSDYLHAKQLIDSCYALMSYDMASTSFITVRLDQLRERVNQRSQYIRDNSEFFYTQRDIFQKYSGTSIGDDPYYTHENMTHASYQIHPYLYNFVEKSNLSYPIANSFHLAFTSNYEQELASLCLDEIVGKYGNVINLWKSDLYDWSGYRSKYETQTNVSDQSNKESPIAGFTGLFYPPALEEFLDNPDVFIMKTQDNDPESYYYHLNLTNDQLAKIADQLRTYQDEIRVVAQRVIVEDELVEPALSNEFDIYKYGEDVYGNSIILLKSYAHLYTSHENDPTYTPSFNDKKNTTGELWMRIKDHPIAFPAFDLRKGYEDVSQYNITEEVNKKGKKLNDYVTRINEDYSSNNFPDGTDKSVLKSTVPSQYLRCFYDMEFDTTNRALLLNMAYQSGTDGRMLQSAKLMSYANSSVMVATLHKQFDYNQNMTVYSFAEDSESNTDNIANPQMFNVVPPTPVEDDIKYDFMGFVRSDTYVYAMFIKKQYKKNESLGTLRWMFPYSRSGQPQISIKPVGYKYATKLYKPTADVAVTDALYNIFDESKVGERAGEFYGVDNVVITSDRERIAIAYVSEQVQPVTLKTDIETENEPYNKNNTKVVNYTEYTTVVEDKSVSAYGQCTTYPRSTAILQTEDDAHDIVYNSFDSFTSYLVTLNFKFSGHALKYTGAKYYNLNTDIGFMPLFADESGKTRFFMNKSLSATTQLNLQLQGPEKAEENATPVIVTPKDEKYGRVTEDYVEYTKFNAYNEVALSVLPNESSVSYVFELSSVLGTVYDDIKETNQLVSYKYMLMNSKYSAVPIAKGVLGNEAPTGYYYNGYEEFDLLSGQELIGPNGVSYQDVGATNHINNVSSIDVETIIDSNTLVPKAVSLTCNVRQKLDSLQVIDINSIKLLVYNQNSLKSYDFYHLLQNSNAQLSAILDDQLSGAPGLKESILEEIDFAEIYELSDYIIPGTTIQPFLSVSTSGDPKYNKISALLEFKYSEENTINGEFPYLDAKDIEDNVTIVANDTQYIYYFALDSFDNIQTDIFTMKKYDVDSKKYITIDVNTRSRKYKAFFDKALTIEATYNVEVVDDKLKPDEAGYYGIVLYFNYKDYTDTPYVSCDYNGYQDNVPPSWQYYDADSDRIKHTYLRLLPGQIGRLDIMIDYLEFDKVDTTNVTQTVVGKESRVIASYYVMNVSQDKPKFKISKTAFS